jgi:hypothetical protein
MGAGAALGARVPGPMSVLGTAALAPAAVRRCRRAFPRPLVPFIPNHLDVLVSKDTGGHWPLALWLKGFGCGTPCCAPGEDAAAKEGAFESERYRVGRDDLGVGVAIAIVSAGIAFVYSRTVPTSRDPNYRCRTSVDPFAMSLATRRARLEV